MTLDDDNHHNKQNLEYRLQVPTGNVVQHVEVDPLPVQVVAFFVLGTPYSEIGRAVRSVRIHRGTCTYSRSRGGADVPGTCTVCPTMYSTN